MILLIWKLETLKLSIKDITSSFSQQILQNKIQIFPRRARFSNQTSPSSLASRQCSSMSRSRRCPPCTGTRNSPVRSFKLVFQETLSNKNLRFSNFKFNHHGAPQKQRSKARKRWPFKRSKSCPIYKPTSLIRTRRDRSALLLQLLLQSPS